MRCGKSCRLRWMNHLCPNVKRGDFSEEEEDLIIRLHNLLGNSYGCFACRWSLIAGRVPGRTDNQVKNHWNTHLRKKLGIKRSSRKVVDSSNRGSTVAEETRKVPADSNSGDFPKNNGGAFEAVSSDLDTKIDVDAFNEEAQALSRHYFEQFGFSNHGLGLNSPGFWEFLGVHSPDLIWQEL